MADEFTGVASELLGQNTLVFPESEPQSRPENTLLGPAIETAISERSNRSKFKVIGQGDGSLILSRQIAGEGQGFAIQSVTPNGLAQVAIFDQFYSGRASLDGRLIVYSERQPSSPIIRSLDNNQVPSITIEDGQYAHPFSWVEESTTYVGITYNQVAEGKSASRNCRFFKYEDGATEIEELTEVPGFLAPLVDKIKSESDSNYSIYMSNTADGKRIPILFRDNANSTYQVYALEQENNLTDLGACVDFGASDAGVGIVSIKNDGTKAVKVLRTNDSGQVILHSEIQLTPDGLTTEYYRIGEEVVEDQVAMVGDYVLRTYNQFGSIIKIRLDNIDNRNQPIEVTLPQELEFAKLEALYVDHKKRQVFFETSDMLHPRRVYVLSMDRPSELSLFYEPGTTETEKRIAEEYTLSRNIYEFKTESGEAAVAVAMILRHNEADENTPMIVRGYGAFGWSKPELSDLGWMNLATTVSRNSISDIATAGPTMVELTLPGDLRNTRLRTLGMGNGKVETAKAIRASVRGLFSDRIGNPQKTLVTGHSAGGHSMLLALAQALNEGDQCFAGTIVMTTCGIYSLENLVSFDGTGYFAKNYWLGEYTDPTTGAIPQAIEPLSIFRGLTEIAPNLLPRSLLLVAGTGDIFADPRHYGLALQVLSEKPFLNKRLGGALVENLKHYDDADPVARARYLKMVLGLIFSL